MTEDPTQYKHFSQSLNEITYKDQEEKIGKILCEPNPCMNGGQCTILFDELTCNCLQGFVGEFCQTDDTKKNEAMEVLNFFLKKLERTQLDQVNILETLDVIIELTETPEYYNS